MLESYNTAQEMKYEKLSAEEQEKRGILGRLVGCIADFKNPTRNGRFYSEKLWENFFNNPLTQEKINEKVFVGELGHPTDRTEVDMEKIAICLAEMPKKGSDGRIHGVFDILNTPNGRILKTLCDYGSHIGVSSRGTGDTYEDYDGRESVDAETFDCECWDAVLVPAVKEARLQYVAESLSNRKTLKQALQESLQNSSPEDQRVMTETLKELDIDINNSEKSDDIEKVEESESDKDAAVDNVVATTLKDLQETLVENSKLKEKIISLQEQLSVCYAKETKLEEEKSQYRSSIITLRERLKATDSGQAKALTDAQAQISQLSEDLQKRDKQIAVLQDSRTRLRESLKQAADENQRLQDKVQASHATISSLREDVSKNNSTSSRLVEDLKAEKQTLQENLEDMKKNSLIKQKEYNSKIESLKESYTQQLTKSQKLIEHYKKIANAAITKYIDTKALHLGVSSSEITARLPKEYSFDDIDRLCEGVEQQIVSVGKLPFSLTNKKARLTESNGVVDRTAKNRFADDVVDESLAKLINN